MSEARELADLLRERGVSRRAFLAYASWMTSLLALMDDGHDFAGAAHKVLNGLFDTAKTGFDISLGLVGVMSLWLGVMKIGERAGFLALGVDAHRAVAQEGADVLRRAAPHHVFEPLGEAVRAGELRHVEPVVGALGRQQERMLTAESPASARDDAHPALQCSHTCCVPLDEPCSSRGTRQPNTT